MFIVNSSVAPHLFPTTVNKIGANTLQQKTMLHNIYVEIQTQFLTFLIPVSGTLFSDDGASI